MSEEILRPASSSQTPTEYRTPYALSPEEEDKLTHIYNRPGFYNKAREMIDAHEPGFYILTCINIDSFKTINDQYGTAVGDQVLCNIAENIYNSIDDMGGICARLAADDFAVLFPASEQNSHRLYGAHSRVNAPSCIVQRIHTRIGRYLVRDVSLPLAAMYDRAKLAADSIRGNYSKNIEYYTDEMRDHMLKRQRVINNMVDALNNGEFEVWLQPQFNHATGAVIGAEALSRWKHEDSYISPADFIPIFEETDFIYQLDLYIWEQCCAILKRWLSSGSRPLPVSVNISPRDITQEDFPETLIGIVSSYDIPKELFRLEITESAFGEDAEQIISKIGELIQMGFTVEIDDFGSGYSSLNSLKDVPAHILKLDMRFFEVTADTERAGTIVASVVRMAKWLNMAVIAEGVETKSQADYLKSIGCHYIQGYYYARPMPVDQYEALLSANKREHKLDRLKTLKTFDNNEFWNPDSMDTLIFNSYVGGACIFEYCRRQTSLLRVNDRFFAQFDGLIPPDAQLNDISLTNYLSDEDRELFYRTIDKALQTRTDASCELSVSLGRNIVYVRDSIRIIAKADDRLLCYCSVTNITEQKMAELHEREALSRMQAIMDNVHSGIIAVKRDANDNIRVVFANNGFYSMLGYTEEQFKDEIANVEAAVFPADLPIINDCVIRTVVDGYAQSCEFRLIRSDQSIIWVQIVTSVLAGSNADLGTILGVITDISADKEYKEQLSFLNSTAHDLLAFPKPDDAIKHTLLQAIDYFEADRAFVFEIDFEHQLMHCSYEQNAPGIGSDSAWHRDIPFDDAKKLFGGMDPDNPTAIKRSRELGEDMAELRRYLISHGISAFVTTPMMRFNNNNNNNNSRYRNLIGFIGIENPARIDKHFNRLSALGDFVAILTTRRDLYDSISAERKYAAKLEASLSDKLQSDDNDEANVSAPD